MNTGGRNGELGRTLWELLVLHVGLAQGISLHSVNEGDEEEGLLRWAGQASPSSSGFLPRP